MSGTRQSGAGKQGVPCDSRPGDALVPGGTVALIGRPNVGKSTLLNRLVQEKVAIVSPVPQTTRNVIRAHLSVPAGRILFLDTPGIHRPHHLMNRRMVRSAFQAMRQADLLAIMVDAEAGVGPGDRFVIRELADVGLPAILLINKVDRVRRPLLLPMIEELSGWADFREIIPLSARSGENCDRLQEILLRHLPSGGNPPVEPGTGDPPAVFLAAEIIREKIFFVTREEVPHSTAVLIDRMEKRGDWTWLDATLIVERDSQKGILIGRQGSLLKEIGENARRELETRWGGKVVLKLWVRSVPNWRGDEEVLSRLGLPTGK